MNKISYKVHEPKLITDEKEIWYCNEVLPLKAKICELEQDIRLLKWNIKQVIDYIENEYDFWYGDELKDEYQKIVETLKRNPKEIMTAWLENTRKGGSNE